MKQMFYKLFYEGGDDYDADRPAIG